MHLLIVSDDEIGAFVLSSAALRRGMSVEYVTSGDGLREALVPTPDVVVVDCETPDARAARAIRTAAAVAPATEIVAIVERATDQERAQLVADGARLVQLKPYHAAELLTLIDR